MEKPESKSSRHRGVYLVLIFALLMITWMIFSGLFDPMHLSLGVISSGIVTWMSADMLFADRSTSILKRGVQAIRMMFYFVWLVWQIVLSNMHLLRLAFAGQRALQPQIVSYETKLETDFEKFLLANSITLTPGTVTMKIIGQTFYIHAISDASAKGLDGEMERRIAKIFA